MLTRVLPLTLLVSLIVITSKLILDKFKSIQNLHYFLKENKNLYEKVIECACYLVCVKFRFHLYNIKILAVNNIFSYYFDQKRYY